MRLFTKYNRVNITAMVLTFLVGSVAFYFVLNYILVRQLDRSLRAEEQEIITYAKKNGHLPEIHDTRHQWIETQTTSTPILSPKPFSDEAFNKLAGEEESIRRYVFTVIVSGQMFRITVNQSKTETEELLQLIIVVTALMIALIVLTNYLVNRKLITRLWRPFYHTIDNIKVYQVSGREPLKLPKEDIDEMNLLNVSLNAMTSRIHEDYLSLKSFTENASHEMQTPLAVIRSKTESLTQMANGDERMMQQLVTIEENTLKLSRLNQSLLLLTKLGNRQFNLDEPVEISDVLQKKISEIEELISAKKLVMQTHISAVTVPFHHHLADILVSNLLTNIIRHTPNGGFVEIDLSKKELVLKNTATGQPLDSTKIFQRFYKGEQSLESTGLGLAIVKEICTLAGFTALYTFEQNRHEFTIRF